MKVNLVKDANGKVVATFENAVAGGPSVKPVLKPGHKVHEVDAPENYKSGHQSLLQAPQPVTSGYLNLPIAVDRPVPICPPVVFNAREAEGKASARVRQP